MIGKTISHYRILEKLGEGGMGVVYKAEDTKLKREVAIKFLPRQIATSDEERQRFKIEAQAAAALNHPNIATIHAIEEHDDEMFIVMEYIEGQELREIISSKTPEFLKLRGLLDYSIQMADGLQAAHKKGITHRDIKSANIMITDEGQVKIMDFGLAKVGGDVQLTKAGTTLGTAAYMSPGQARGEKVDHRTDIWSFGVVLYEMLTGGQPFKGDYEQAVVYSILNEAPEPVTGLRTGVPMELEKIINKCLEKEPPDRYPHADDLLVDLQSLQQKLTASGREVKRKDRRPAPVILPIILLLFAMVAVAGYFMFRGERRDKPELHSLAVLPFANLRSNPETNFLGFALADQIIGDLTYLKSIWVRPSSAVREYQNQVVNAQTAGDDLKVDYILTGNYLKEAKDIRLNVELVEVHTNEMIWREPIEVQYENAFKLQDIVSEKVIHGLRVQFSPDERERMQIDMPRDPLAYEYYLRSLSYRLTSKGDSLAIGILKKSIQLDSTYAPAFVELGYRSLRLAQHVVGAAEEAKKAEQYCLKALTLNPEQLSALGNLALIYTDIGRTEDALELVRRALKINPNDAWAHYRLSYIYRYTGMLNESEQEVEKALKLHPGNLRFRSAGLTYLYLGKYKKALKTFDLDEGNPWVLGKKGAVLLRHGKPDEAIVYFDEVLETEAEGQWGLYVTGMRAYIKGNREEGLQATRRMELGSPHDSELLYEIAVNYGLLGDAPGCVRVLRKAVEGGFFNYPFMLRDSFLDPVRDDPEFQRVLALAKAKHEAFKKRFFEGCKEVYFKSF